MGTVPNNDSVLKHNLRLVAWEITKKCNLACIHCRASSSSRQYDGELVTSEAISLMDEIAALAKPIVILTGGEPLLREDIFDIVKYGDSLGLRMVMAPNGTLITKNVAKKILDSGIKRVSISLDGPDNLSHDMFRGVQGAFESAISAIKYIREIGIEFQINTTITKSNFDQIPAILKLAENLGAVAHHIFLLVPTGRGKYIADKEINGVEYEKILNWFYDQRSKTSLQLKATCAPHYYRILRQRAKSEGKKVSFETYGLDAVTRGCLAGTAFCFISHKGSVQPCGYTNVDCGNITSSPFDIIWAHSPVFKKLRDLKQFKGKCGRCEYVRVCGGCRARGFEATGNYMSEEPLCNFEPTQPRY